MIALISMTQEYYAPTPVARATINKLLDLPAKGDEQDWEIELSAPDKLDNMFALMDAGVLNFEERSALALLLMYSVDEIYREGGDTSALFPRLKSLLTADPDVLGRMRYYWGHLHLSEAIMQQVLG
ncbi:hypothetical protein CAP39_00805 [Sphingomonas sp. IBVSS1]|nr:hypothetical protein CAP39_00805 [Sphingomonas sp. IBVSS1]